MTLTYRLSKGSELTFQELDNNFTHVLDAANLHLIQAGTGAQTRTVQDKSRDVISIKDFGAVGDGVTDDTAAIQAAINAATAGAVAGIGTYPAGNHFGLCAEVYTPPSANGYVVSNVTILAPITLRGSNPRGSRWIGKSGATGYMVNVDGFNASASLTNQYGLPGVHIIGMGFEGNNRQVGYGALYLSSIAYFSLDHLNIELFDMEAMNFYTSCLEGHVSNINMRYCGNVATGYLQVNLIDSYPAGITERDAHNMITFENIWSIFPFGNHFGLDTVTGRTFLVRDIQFNNIYCHALADGGISGEPTPTLAQEATAAFVIKSAQNTVLANVRVPLMGKGYPSILQTTGSHATGPSGTIINGLILTGRPDTTTPRVGIQLEAGDISLNNANISSCQEGSIVTTTGTNIRIGYNVVVSDPTSLAAATLAISNIWIPRIDQRVTLTDAATITIDASLGNNFFIGMGATGRTLDAPSNPTDGQLITIDFAAVGGGVPTTLAFNAIYSLTGGTFQIGSTLHRQISFRYSSALSLWQEVSRSPNQDGGIFAMTDAATITVNGTAASTYTVILTAARQLLNPTNRTPGKRYEFIIIQDGTGGHNLTFDTAYKVSWSNTGNVAGARSSIVFVDDATCTYMTQIGAQSPYI